MKSIIISFLVILQVFSSLAFCQSVAEYGISPYISKALPDSKDYELEFTLLSSTEYEIVDTAEGVGYPTHGTGQFPLMKWPHLYISCTVWGLMVWNISDLVNPVMLSHTDGLDTEPDMEWGLGQFDISQDTLLIGRGGRDNIRGLNVVNIVNPYHPFHVTSYEIEGHNRQTIVDGNFAYQCYFESDGSELLGINGLVTFDITVPEFPIFADSIRTPGQQSFRLWKAGDYAYIFNVSNSPGGPAGFSIINVRNPYNLEFISHTPFYAIRHGVVYGDFLYCFGVYESKVIYIADPYTPFELYSFEGIPTNCLTMDYPYIFCSTGGGIAIVDISIPERPHIAGWQPGSYWDGTGDYGRSILIGSTMDELDIYSFEDTGIDEESLLPVKMELLCYPNPFNSTVNIQVACGIENDYPHLQVEIYDLNGELVSKKKEGFGNPGSPDNRITGSSIYRWEPDTGIPSGIYLVKINAGEYSASRKVLYLK